MRVKKLIHLENDRLVPLAGSDSARRRDHLYAEPGKPNSAGCRVTGGSQGSAPARHGERLPSGWVRGAPPKIYKGTEEVAFILGTDGIYLAHTDQQKIGASAKNDFAPEILQTFFSADNGSIDNTDAGQIIGYAAIPG